jgi:hypothetical protein
MSYRSDRKRAAFLIFRGLGAIIAGIALCFLVASLASDTGGTLIVGGVPIGLLLLAGGLVKGVVDIWRALELLGVASRIGNAFDAFERTAEAFGGLVLHTGLGLLVFCALGLLAMLLLGLIGIPAIVLNPQPTEGNVLLALLVLLPPLALWLSLSAYFGCLGWENRKLHWTLKAILVVLLIPLLVGLYWVGRGGIAFWNRHRG